MALRRPSSVALHAAVVPHHVPELLVEGVDRPGAVDRQQLVDPAAARRSTASSRRRVVVVDLRERTGGQVVVDRVRQHEVAVGQPLHQGAGAQPVRPVVGEVGLAGDVQARDRRLQVVVDPQPAHRVVHRRVDPHRRLVRVLAGDLGVHVEEVAVLGLDRLAAQPLDRVGEVQVDPEPARADPATLVADVLGRAGGDVAGHQVAERRVDPLQVVVAVVLAGSPARVALVLPRLRHPDPAVVAQRLAHQGQLGLVLTGHRDAGRVDLGVAGVARSRRPCGGPARWR